MRHRRGAAAARLPEQLLSWLNIAARPAGSSFTQSPAGRYSAGERDDWEAGPGVSERSCNLEGTWIRLDDDGPADVTGRLIGGCIETVCHLAGTPYGDAARFSREHAPEGTIVYVEAAEADAYTICRSLHGMRLAGFFDAANAVIAARTAAPDGATLTQHAAVLDALGSLGIPIIADVECGHVPPYLPLVNGALAR